MKDVQIATIEPQFYRLNPLSFSVRVANAFQARGLTYVGELVQLDELTLLRMKYFGRKALGEVKQFLAPMNLNLGMTINGWQDAITQHRRTHGEPPLTPPRDFGRRSAEPVVERASVLSDFANAQKNVTEQAQKLVDRVKSIDQEIAALEDEKVAVITALSEYRRGAKS